MEVFTTSIWLISGCKIVHKKGYGCMIKIALCDGNPEVRANLNAIHRNNEFIDKVSIELMLSILQL